MKKLYTLLLLFCYSTIAFAQWTVLNPGVTNTLRAPFFLNSDTGFVVGEAILPANAPILKTTDGGLSWALKESGTTNNLRAVHFVDDSVGIACGFTGTILRTTNAGETWSIINSGTTQALRSVYFPSHD